MPLWKIIEPSIKTPFDIDEYGKLSHLYSKLAVFSIPHPPAIAFPNKFIEKKIQKEELDECFSVLKQWKKETNQENGFALELVVTSGLESNEDIFLPGIGFNLSNLETLTKTLDIEVLKECLLNLFCRVMFLMHAHSLKNGHLPPSYEDLLKQVLKLEGITDSDIFFIESLKLCKTDNELMELLKSHRSLGDGMATEFFSNTMNQLRLCLHASSKWVKEKDEFASALLRVLIRPDWDMEAQVGKFFTNDIRTGDENIVGYYVKNSNLITEKGGIPLANLSAEQMAMFEDISAKIRSAFNFIQEVFFIRKNGEIWISNLQEARSVTLQADLGYKIKKAKTGKISDKEIIESISPEAVRKLLHPVLDKKEATQHEELTGGIHGSYGAARGRIYFSADALLEAYDVALSSGAETDFILAMPAIYAQEVKAVKIARGVISSEGGIFKSCAGCSKKHE